MNKISQINARRYEILKELSNYSRSYELYDLFYDFVDVLNHYDDLKIAYEYIQPLARSIELKRVINKIIR